MKSALTIFTTFFLTLAAWGSSYKILYTFAGGADGANPIDSGTLTIDHYDGSLYGTTQYGGQCGQGTVFRLSPNGKGGWSNTVRHSFCGGADGAYPFAGVEGGGWYYYCPPGDPCNVPGVVTYGGPGNQGGSFSSQLAQPYYWFGSLWGGGAFPYAQELSVWYFGYPGPQRWPDDVYTAFDGGLNGYGGVYGGREGVRYDFCSLPGCADGANPASSIGEDGGGNRYGMTMFGGGNNQGVLYEWISDNNGAYDKGVVVLHSFAGGTNDGAYPFIGGLTLGTQQVGTMTEPAIWGTTPEGGGTGCSGSGCGTVFKMVKPPCFVLPCPGWNFSLLHSFTGGSDGGFPYSGLTNVNGTLYGTTNTGGAYGGGTIYSISPNGTFSVVYNFGFTIPSIYYDGKNPYSGLVADSNGNLYGVTYQGGQNNVGVVFEFTP